MALDPYSSCPCGSGKKFKWCCQPIYVGINRAFEQEANGQHDAALRTLDEVVQANPGNPEVWGQKAKLLYAHGQAEEAEKALQKAFDLNPHYPFGLLLQAMFRFNEGETAGALLLARRAAEAYDPEAHEYLAQAYSIIFECEMKMNRPVAARAALRLVTHSAPADEETRNAFDAYFGKDGRLPAAARRDYALLSPAPTVGGERRAAWDRALDQSGSPRLSDVARAFTTLTEQDAGDAAAWFNLGVARAWLGDNRWALDALQHYLDVEKDEDRGVTAATLAEVLRCGQGMEDDADYHENAFLFQVRDPQPVQALLDDWARARRLLPMQAPQEGTFIALVLELTTASLITVGGPPADAGRLAGYLLLMGNLMQFTSPLKEAFDRTRDEMRQRLALGLDQLQDRRAPIQFQDVVAEALLFPITKVEDAEQRVLDHAAKFYEETWIHRPRRSLGGNTPVDAAGHAGLRTKLRGVIQFIEDCARTGMLQKYDFDRLRRKLGLTTGGAAVPPPATGTATVSDIPSLGAAELAALKPEGLSDEQLEQAYQAAQKLDADELAAHFAKALVGRPPRPEHADRYPWYAYLTQHALKEGNTDAALDYVNEGEKADCEHNEGRRRNDYELRRGQVHVKRGEADAAEDVFRRLIDRAPGEPRLRGSAAEAMLSLKQGARALRFAEEGLDAARQQNDRDSEQYLMELAAAARKQMG